MTELESGENILPMLADGAITAGDHVELSGARKVKVATAANDGQAGLGIAMYDASDGDPIAVAAVGCVVRDANIASAVSANDLLSGSGTAGRLDAASTGEQVLGIALEDAADNKGVILITGPGGIESET